MVSCAVVPDSGSALLARSDTKSPPAIARRIGDQGAITPGGGGCRLFEARASVNRLALAGARG